MRAPDPQVNEKRTSRTRFAVRRTKQEQLEENELRYVAWGACFCDNISALRDGMRCTESKLTIISCVSRL